MKYPQLKSCDVNEDDRYKDHSQIYHLFHIANRNKYNIADICVVCKFSNLKYNFIKLLQS
jgi:hypothetical protein